MRVICKRLANKGNRAGIAAYELIAFRHHPLDKNPVSVCALANCQQCLITCGERDSEGVLDRIVEDLLSPSGVADCRRYPQVSVEFSKDYAQRVYISNKWANAYTTQYHDDPERPCLVVAAITS